LTPFSAGLTLGFGGILAGDEIALSVTEIWNWLWRLLFSRDDKLFVNMRSALKFSDLNNPYTTVLVHPISLNDSFGSAAPIDRWSLMSELTWSDGFALIEVMRLGDLEFTRMT
jgi:hypothetical protein